MSIFHLGLIYHQIVLKRSTIQRLLILRQQYSMATNSIKELKQADKSSPYLPIIDRLLSKSKKYYYSEKNKENVLRSDIDSIIHHLVNHNAPTCEQKLQRQHQRYISNKIEMSTLKNAHLLQYLPKRTHQSHELKTIRQQIRKYLSKMAKREAPSSSDYHEFVRLSQQSQDYLEYYLKNQFKSQDNFKLLQSTDKKIILSMLKNNYRCLTDNPPEISNRILLSLTMNPLNDFHFVDWPIFSRFRKLTTGAHTKADAKNFLIHYFLVSNKTITKTEFLAINSGILRKLEVVMNKSNVERLIERIEASINEELQPSIGRQEMQQLMTAQPLQIWQELLELIFMV